ncbi:MAG: arylsulfatase [Bryobacterales bacterium]|nr:arylsulfatase [Bryobacterales bacterium]
MTPISRRAFVGAAAASLACGRGRRPNVVLIMSDDQGYGDLSLHGNPHLRTPHTDRLARDGAQLTQFHVSPVCAPTRASLLTGRYNYRTGVVDTYLGRAMMHTEEVTLAEILRDAGYRTGIFGKWHLGDNYPLRAMDQGFTESLLHNGGGIGQPSDPPGNLYFDPFLQHNGRAVQRKGYCTDIFFDAAMEWIADQGNQPFFAYIATNAPHTPLQVDERYVAPFREQGLDETTARVYGMVVNLDENIGRLTQRLDELGRDRDTIVIFLTDNGPQQDRFNAGMRGRKGSVYQGGIRVPCFVRWPGVIEAGRTIGEIAAHIDMVPTLLEACGVVLPSGLRIDGTSLWPALTGKGPAPAGRTLVFQWHRGDEPESFRASAVRTQRYKLVDGSALYDLEVDPAESRDLSGQQPELVATLRTRYEEWFRDVSSTRGYAPPRIHIGTPHENPVTLTRQDWRGPRAGWDRASLGHWEVYVASPGPYRVRLRFEKTEKPAPVRFRLGNRAESLLAPAGTEESIFTDVVLAEGEGRVEASVGDVGVQYVDFEKI